MSGNSISRGESPDLNLMSRIIKNPIFIKTGRRQRPKGVLGSHARVLGNHARVLGSHARVLGRHARVLGKHARVLGRHA